MHYDRNKDRVMPIGVALVFEHKTGGQVIGTSAVKLIGADPYRVAITITNGSTNIAYIGLGPDVSASNGIAVDQYAYPRTISDDTHPGLAGQEIWVIGSAVATNIGYITTRLVE